MVDAKKINLYQLKGTYRVSMCLFLLYRNLRRNSFARQDVYQITPATWVQAQPAFLLYRNLRRNSFARWDVYEIVLATRVQAQPVFLSPKLILDYEKRYMMKIRFFDLY